MPSLFYLRCNEKFRSFGVNFRAAQQQIRVDMVFSIDLERIELSRSTLPPRPTHLPQLLDNAERVEWSETNTTETVGEKKKKRTLKSSIMRTFRSPLDSRRSFKTVDEGGKSKVKSKANNTFDIAIIQRLCNGDGWYNTVRVCDVCRLLLCVKSIRFDTWSGGRNFNFGLSARDKCLHTTTVTKRPSGLCHRD